MSVTIKNIAQSKLFVPIIIILLLLVAISSFKENKNSTAISNLTIEKQLEDMCNSVDGVKNAKVMITYEAVQTVSLFESGSKYAKIQGIAVVCEGGGDPTVQLKLYDMLRALFGVSSTQITVTERKIHIVS